MQIGHNLTTLYTTIKPFIILKQGTVLYSFSEYNFPELYFDLFYKKYKFIIPLNNTPNKIHADQRYVSHFLKNIDGSFPKQIVTYNYKYIETKQPCIIDINSIFYKTVKFYSNIKNKTSKQFITKLFDLSNVLNNLAPKEYRNHVLHYVLDVSNFQEVRFSKTTLQKMFLGSILSQLSNLSITDLIITVKKDEQYFSFLAYKNGKYSIVRIINTLNMLYKLDIQKRKQELEEKLPILEKKLTSVLDSKEEVLTVTNEVSKYLLTHPDIPIKMSDNSVKQYIKLIIKEENVDISETENFKKLAKSLINLKIPKLVVKKSIMQNDEIANTFLDDKVLGNAINSREYLIKEGLEYQIKIFKEYFKKKYGISLLNISEENLTSDDDIYSSTVKRMIFTFKDSNGKTFQLSVKLPKLEKNFFYINGKKRSLIYQLYPSPVQTVKTFDTLLKTNYASIRFLSKTKNKYKGLFVYVAGEELPYPIFLLGAFKNKCQKKTGELCDECVKFMFSISGISLKESDVEPNNTIFKFKFSDIWYYMSENVSPKSKQIFWSFLVFYKKVGELRDCDQLIYKIGELYHGRIIDNVYQTVENILDPVTIIALKSENLPTTPLKLFNYCVEQSISGITTSQADLSKKRLRNAEIIGTILFKKLNPILMKYHIAQKHNSKFEPKLDENVVINTFLAGEAQSQFQLVDDNNPLSEASHIYRTTYSGYGGILTEFATPDQRTVHVSQYCSLDPVDSPDSNAVGVIRNLAVDSELDKSIGKFKIKDIKKECNTFSPSTLYSPFVSHNDGNRLQFVSAHLKSDIPLKQAELPIIASTFSNMFIDISSDLFVIKSPVDGNIINITEDGIILQNNKTKKHILIPFPNQKELTDSTGVNYVPVVNVGDSVKKNQAIITAEAFFKTDILTLGINAHTALMPYDVYNFEDAIVVSESFAKRMTSTHIKQQEILIPPGETIVPTSLPAIGDQITGSSPIIQIAPNLNMESTELTVMNMFNEFSDDDFNDDDTLGEDIQLDDSNNTDSESSKDKQEVIDTSIKTGLYKLIYPTVTKGVIKNIEIFAKDEESLKAHKPLYNLWKKLKEDVEQKIQQYRKQKIDVSNLEQKYSTILNPFGKKYKGEVLEGVLIRVTYYYEKRLEEGDKLHNRHGNKGTISRIIPDDLMPRTKLGQPLEILINLIGIIGRKNAGQFLELYAGKIVHHYNLKFRKEMDAQRYNRALNIVIDLYKKMHPDKEYVKELEKKFLSMSDKNRTKLLEDMYKHGVILFLDPVKHKLSIEKIQQVLKSLNLPPEEYLYIPEEGRKTKIPVATGYMYWHKTKHMSSKKLHARSIGKREGKSLQASQGKKQEGGQRYSEIDIMNLYTYDLKNFMTEIISLSSDDINSKFKMINTIYRTGKIRLDELEKISSTSGVQFKVYLECMGVIEPS